MAQKHPAPNRGTQGEDAAAIFLENSGFRILTRNFKVTEGELDIVAEKNALVHIVEVKQRANDKVERPAAWVNTAKQNRLRTAAMYWLSQSGCKMPFCFDIVEILGDEITLIENAF
ncbi:MAG TPA: YraN family protein [Oscillospiraceae bacterium]|nr:YraN family protein [Oscillospiraceae bacterium]HPF55889.1 YraN family protein [Clostridiales bacterium]HPK35014.1 YraN family protein [Oscillospiraceae bacterium]HPR76263.1 YraN family protein [Oscillospiraceae bacterium]